jgi:RimJ/RimL family protein N-acetyltransferase
MGQVSFSALMEIYAESIAAAARERWPGLSEMEGLYRAEMDFYQYLRQDFFTQGDSFYVVAFRQKTPVAAARMERWRSGWLLEGLETHPAFRGQGYGTQVLSAAVAQVAEPVYAHVRRENAPSLRVHEKGGFRVAEDTAMVDGSYLPGFVTVKLER